MAYAAKARDAALRMRGSIPSHPVHVCQELLSVAFDWHA